MEIWKDIEGFEGLYKISNFGRVASMFYKRGKVEKLLSPSINGDGYYNVSLRKDNIAFNRTVHVLVATHFVDNPYNLPQVNHLDLNKFNCRYDNLEWCTSGDNTRHYHKNKHSILLDDRDGVLFKHGCSAGFRAITR